MAVQYGFPERLCEPMQVTRRHYYLLHLLLHSHHPHLHLTCSISHPSAGGGGELRARGAARRVRLVRGVVLLLDSGDGELGRVRRGVPEADGERRGRSRRGPWLYQVRRRPLPLPRGTRSTVHLHLHPARRDGRYTSRPPPCVAAAADMLRRAQARLVPDGARHVADALAEPHAALLPPPAAVFGKDLWPDDAGNRNTGGDKVQATNCTSSTAGWTRGATSPSLVHEHDRRRRDGMRGCAHCCATW